MLKLYDYFRSSAAFRVRIALHLKKIEFETIPIHLLNNGGEQFKAAYKQMNPQNLVPTLVDGDQVVTQSIAIIEYLEDRFKEPSLLPKDFYKKAVVKSFALSIACDSHPLNNLRVLTYLKNELHLSEEQKNSWYAHWMHKSLSALETMLEKENEAPFCYGETPSLADICLIPQLFNARRFELDLSPYRRLQAVEKNCITHPAFVNAWPQEPTKEKEVANIKN